MSNYPGGMTKEEFERRLAALAASEKAAVTQLGDQIGYGRIMQLCHEIWSEKDMFGGALVTGPCAALTVPCGCEVQHQCDWCCGSGWLTEHVKHVKDQLEPTTKHPSEFYMDTHYWVLSDAGEWWPMYLTKDWHWRMSDGGYIPHKKFIEMMKDTEIVEALEPPPRL